MARRRDHQLSQSRRLWLYGGLVAFILIDAVLVGWAMSTASTGEISGTPRPAPTFTPKDPSPSPSAEVPEPQDITVVAVPATRLLAVVDSGTAWRATTGACPGTPASPELTTDGGANWKSTDATGPTGVTALQRLLPSDDRTASMIGLSAADCSPQFIRTWVAGDNYAVYASELGGTWYINPANRAIIHSPLGDVAAPCTAIALGARDANAAAVLCDTQTVFATTDAGTTWSLNVAVPGAITLAATQGGYVVSAVGLTACAGVQVVTLTEASFAPSAPGCFQVDLPPEALPGNVAISESSGALWVWAGDHLGRSADGGATWQ